MKNPMLYPLLVVGFILCLLCSSCEQVTTKTDTFVKSKEDTTSGIVQKVDYSFSTGKYIVRTQIWVGTPSHCISLEYSEIAECSKDRLEWTKASEIQKALPFQVIIDNNIKQYNKK